MGSRRLAVEIPSMGIEGHTFAEVTPLFEMLVLRPDDALWTPVVWRPTDT